MFYSRCCNAKTVIMSTRGTKRIRKCTKCDKIFWTEEVFDFEPEHRKLNKRILDDLREIAESDLPSKVGKPIKFNLVLKNKE